MPADSSARTASTLICGSIAFDSIMVFSGRFKDHILPDQVHILNVSFLVPSLRREFGGCAGNIAYNLALLGGAPLPMATVGDDAQPYLDHLDRLRIDRRHVLAVPGNMTAQAFITTDLDDNQITAFHPGAMSQSHLNRIEPGVRLAILGPDGREGMLAHAQQMADHGIPFIFDPGQGMPMFEAAELDWFVGRARYLALNDYEARLMSAKTGHELDTLARRLEAVIVTRGAQGSIILTGGKSLTIPPAPARVLTDPTGCGDAYRAGLLYGISNGMDWPTTGRLASVMGALKIELAGAQRHTPSRDQIAERFGEAFGYKPW
jgi:adenosine kinase